jgi:PadR family transcriptional regulator, regulatory protein PadR
LRMLHSKGMLHSHPEPTAERGPGVRPLSATSLAVATAILGGSRYGFDIMDATYLPSGTVYPVLSRLEKSGLVQSRWEDQAVAQEDGRPARRYYRLTEDGQRALAASATYYRDLTARLVRDGLPLGEEPAGG